MTYLEIINIIAKDINKPAKEVDKLYKLYWKFIKDSIEKLPLKDNISEEEFNTIRTNFNIPSLGKLNCTYSKLTRIKSNFNKRNKDDKD